MNIYFPRSNRTFHSISACTNHIVRTNYYETIEDAYIDVYNIDITSSDLLCEFCKSNRKEFIGFTKGYHNTRCESKECKKKNIRKRNIELGEIRKYHGDENFDKYILKNIEKYRNLYLNNYSYFDEYWNCEVKDAQKFIRSRTSSNFNSKIKRKCVVSDKEYYIDLLTYKNEIELYVTYHNGYRKYRTYDLDFIIEFSYDKKEFNETKDLSKKIEIFSKYKDNSIKNNLTKDKKYLKYIENLELGNIKNFYGYDIKKNNYGVFRLDKFIPINILKEKFNYISECVNCKKEFISHKIEYNHENGFNLQKIRSNIVCSNDCYSFILKNRKDEIYPVSNDQRIKQSSIMKTKIENGEWTPCVTNSWSHSRIETRDGKMKFRSSWEAVFYIKSIIDGLELEYEDVRIKYFNGEKYRNYIVDFSDHENKILYEVKPEGNKKGLVSIKEQAALDWCKNNGYEFKFISEEWFYENMTEDLFTEVLKQCIIDEDKLHKRMKQFMENN